MDPEINTGADQTASSDQNTNQATSATADAPSKWYDGVKDEVLKGLAVNKGWSDPDKALKSYSDLEKRMGAGPDALLRLDDLNNPAERAKLNKVLGVPSDASGYALNEIAGADADFSNQASVKFHEAGLSKEQANSIANWYQEQVAQSQAAFQESFEQTNQIEIKGLEKEWGGEFKPRTEIARRAVRDFGLNPVQLQGIEQAIGAEKLMKMFYTLGKGKAESRFETGSEQSTNYGLTPAEARAKSANLMSDPEWRNNYLAKKPKEVDQFQQLMKIQAGS